MSADRPMVSLGFGDQCFPAGVHICQIFNDDQERLDALLKFMKAGIENGERTACFSDKLPPDCLDGYLGKHGHSFQQCCDSGALTCCGTGEVYFKDGHFDPDRMLSLLKEYHAASVQGGYPAARVIGEMTADVQHIPGGARLVEYETRVSQLLRDHPVTAVCQYDANAFDGAMIMQILKVHPMMIVRDTVVINPFYIGPEEWLARHL